MVDRRVLLLVVLAAVLLCPGCEHTPSPAEKQTELVWKEVGTWSGHGNQQLETFPIEHFTWRVKWEAKNESPPIAATAAAFWRKWLT